MTTPFRRLVDTITPMLLKELAHDVEEAARQTLFNVVATAVGASQQSAVDIVTEVLAPFSDEDGCRVLGRNEKLTPLDAALVTGIAAHLDDYDDTHLRTVIHPGAVELATLVALQHQIRNASAVEVLRAVTWGTEVQLRLGNSISPAHYDEGWHITGTCGPVGAALTSAILLGLTPEQTVTALNLAAESAVGNREGFGSMTKPFHPGQAAVHGVRATQYALQGATDPGDTITGPSGLATRLARGAFIKSELIQDLGSRWEITRNTFKPYPCGIVTHPAIEAAENLHAEIDTGVGAIDEIILKCHPLVSELTGNLTPADGLQARFSTAHGVAAGLITGRVDLKAYEDQFVTSAQPTKLRSVVNLVPDETCERDAAHLTVRVGDEWFSSKVHHVRGSLAQPMTTADLRTKAEGLIEPVLPGATDRVEAALRREGDHWFEHVLDSTMPSSPSTCGERPIRPSIGDHADARLATWISEGDVTVPDVLKDEVQRLSHLGGKSSDPREVAAEIATEAAKKIDPAIATALGAAAALGSDIESVARAVTVGGGVTLLLSQTLNISPVRAGRVAAGVSACAVLGNTSRACLDAMGIVATQVTGVGGVTNAALVEDLTFEAADSSRDGVTAALLAKAGFTGPDRPLTGRRGLVTLLGHQVAQTDTVVEIAKVSRVVEDALI